MTTTPDGPTPRDEADSKAGEAPGAEIGVSDDEGSTFEPEEDTEGES